MVDNWQWFLVQTIGRSPVAWRKKPARRNFLTLRAAYFQTTGNFVGNTRKSETPGNEAHTKRTHFEEAPECAFLPPCGTFGAHFSLRNIPCSATGIPWNGKSMGCLRRNIPWMCRPLPFRAPATPKRRTAAASALTLCQMAHSPAPAFSPFSGAPSRCTGPRLSIVPGRIQSCPLLIVHSPFSILHSPFSIVHCQ